MKFNKETVITASVSALVALVASEALRRYSRTRTRYAGGGSLAWKELGAKLRAEEFEIKDGEVFLNSGSFGIAPNRLQEKYCSLMKERESSPNYWFFKVEADLLKEALSSVADFIGAKTENMVFVGNTTTATNTVLRSLKFIPGDKILYANFHTYEAIFKQIKQICLSNPGVEMVTFDIPMQPESSDQIVAAYSKVLDENPGIKIAMVDHITSATAILMPIKDIIKVCHDRGVLVCIDGAHTPGQLSLTVEDYGADFYAGNLCKWLLCPRGAGFLWVHPDHRDIISPVIISHMHFSSDLHERFSIFLTADTIPLILSRDAVDFHKALGGTEVITPQLQSLISWGAEMLAKAWNTRVTSLPLELRAPLMLLVLVPQELMTLHDPSFYISLDVMYRILDRGVTALFVCLDGEMWCRLSCNLWNDKTDFYRLKDAVLELKAEVQSKTSDLKNSKDMHAELH